ncbi:hypothetical protein ACFE04_009256 [Oxalis oulophora]
MDVWANIPIDPFSDICERLVCVKDQIVLTAVCKSWHLLFNQLFGKYQFSIDTPRLILAEEDKRGSSSSTDMRKFFDLSNGKLFDFYLPEIRNKKCLSVGFGCALILSGKLMSFKTFFFSKRLLQPILGIQNFKDFDPNCVIIVTYGIGFPAIVKIGLKAWIDIDMKYGWYSDIIYYKNQFYAGGQHQLFAGTIDGNQAPFATPIAHTPRNLVNIHTQKYLVESVGELLLVYRNFVGNVYNNLPPDSLEISLAEIPYWTMSFDVVKLIKKNENDDEHGYEFVKVETLGNQALFVGDGASFSLPATSLNGCRPDCIYFTDDSQDFYSLTKNGGGYDMGIYNLRDGSIEQHYKGESLSYFSTPLWYL